jgi:hypothetical protein
MTTPTPPTQVPPPTPPQSTDPLNFDARADAFVAWFPTAWQYLTSLVNWITARANDISGWAATASAAAAAAFATANASMWASGATYAVGVNVIDPVDMLTYRRKTAGAGTTRPGQDATNWTLLTGQGDVLLSAPQTLSNKTLTNPTINGFTGGTQVIDIGSGQLYKDALGNFGLGTIFPIAKITIKAVNTEGGISLEADSDNLSAPALRIIGKRVDSNASITFSGRALLARHHTTAYISEGINLGGVLFGGNHTNSSIDNILYSASIVGVSEGDFSSSTNMPTGLAFLVGATGIGPNVANVAAGTVVMRLTHQGNLIQSAPTTPPSLDTNGTLVLNLTSNTNLRVTARCPDGVTRTANITLS